MHPTRSDWLLRLIAPGEVDEPRWLDRVRIVKALFLLQRGGLAPQEVDYTFTPYHYGPFSPEIYRDLDALLGAGFVAVSPTGRDYRVTDLGLRRLGLLKFDKKSSDEVMSLRRKVSGLSFRHLLRTVYEAFPDMAVNSRARDVLE